MKKIVYYFNHKVQKMFVEKVNDEGEKQVVLSSPHNFVSPAEIVMRVIDIDSDDQIPTRIDPEYDYYNVDNFTAIKIESGVYYDDTVKAYKASEYGFIIIRNQKLKVLPPMAITRDKLKAYFNIFPTKLGKLPSVKDIEELMHDYKILAGVGEKKLTEQVSGIDPGNKVLAKILVAQGKEPVTGNDEYYLPLINIEKKAGEILEDGRIDFKETGAIIQVAKDQEILQRVPAVKPIDGYDIYGDRVTAEFEPPKGYVKGENIVQSGHDENIYLAAIDGCLEVTKRSIGILPVAFINGDVNYDSGNVDFNGSVHVSGSVISGFSVKATGDVIIEKSVEDAYVQADGDITVKMGVVGKESARLISGGKIVAKYLLNARVESAGEIIVEDSIINSDVFSNDKISVVAKHGKIIGGRSTALYEIIVNVAGAVNETETVLNVGRNLFIERELRDVQKEISRWRENVSEVMRKLKVNFGEAVFENPKEFIAILPTVKKKNCLVLLKELSDSNRELKSLVQTSQEIQSKLKLEREPYIIVYERIFPGAVLNVKKSVRKIEKSIENAKFYEDQNDKLIRFTAAK